MTEVSAAIFIENNKVLLAKRSPEKNLGGYWEFPGGKRENNETILECLEREIFEELNVKCKAIEIFCENMHENERGAIKLIAIISELIDREIILKDHSDYEWVEINRILSYKLAPADIFIAELLIAKYNQLPE